MSRTETTTQTTTNHPFCQNEEQFHMIQLKEVDYLKDIAKKDEFKPQIVWKMVIFYALLHAFSLYGCYQLITAAKWFTCAWVVFTWGIAVLGITAGAHRLYSHKCYSANLPLRIIVMIMNCVSHQNDMIDWARDHRCHHKWTDTDADPHNVIRGFLFSHIGWVLQKSTQRSEKWRRFYLPLAMLFCFVLPTAIPVYFWQEKALVAFSVAVFRYCCSLHSIFFVNSVAHTIGYRPYDSTISPTEVIWMTASTLGEGGHNYHHAFPQDYRTSEFHLYKHTLFNFTLAFIEFFAWLGWATDLKTVNRDTVKSHIIKHGQIELLSEKKISRIIIFCIFYIFIWKLQ
uniref:Uncharacterized protein n=1 Tax=Ditylenchus dipsaci TaxID=166011 RepID=A0A915EQB2_9BILA